MKKKKLPKQGFVEYIDVIDKNNRVMEVLTMHEVHARKLPHRTSHILIFNRDRELFLQKRGLEVFNFPNYWTTSASGHVPAGWSYKKTAYKELKEELGVRCRLTKIGFYWVEFRDNIERNTVFAGWHDGPFKFSDEDVAGGRFFDLKYMKRNYNKFKTDLPFRKTWECFLENGGEIWLG